MVCLCYSINLSIGHHICKRKMQEGAKGEATLDIDTEDRYE